MLAKVLTFWVRNIHQVFVGLVKIRLGQANGNWDNCVTAELYIATAPLLHLSRSLLMHNMGNWCRGR